MTRPFHRRVVVGLVVGAAGFSGTGCIADGHPLGGNGKVEIVVSEAGPLFATDLLDENGQPVGARQAPFQSDVLLRIEEDDEVGHGAFVHIHVEPAEALIIGSALDPKAEGGVHENEEDPTCSIVDGAFRCRGNGEGFARFSIKSTGDWSGTAKIVATWANLEEEALVEVKVAGLPEEATNFTVIGIGADEFVPAKLDALECSVDSVPNELGDAWPEGRIRKKQIFVRASAPSTNPGVLENAPVIIESLSPEGALSLDENCETRSTRLRVLLDFKGESPKFFACFSDVGGTVEFGVSSGELRIPDNRVVTVEPEPRLIRVRVLEGQQTVEQDFVPVEIFEVAAYDVNLRPIPVAVDLGIDTDTDGVFELTEASVTTAPADADPVLIRAVPATLGEGRLMVTPRLLSEPECLSELVTVVESEF